MLIAIHSQQYPTLGQETSGTLEFITHRYPTPPTKQDPAMKNPRLCRRSENHDAKVSTMAATAYGGTVSSCAIALAEGFQGLKAFMHEEHGRLTEPKSLNDGR